MSTCSSVSGTPIKLRRVEATAREAQRAQAKLKTLASARGRESIFVREEERSRGAVRLGHDPEPGAVSHGKRGDDALSYPRRPVVHWDRACHLEAADRSPTEKARAPLRFPWSNRAPMLEGGESGLQCQRRSGPRVPQLPAQPLRPSLSSRHVRWEGWAVLLLATGEPAAARRRLDDGGQGLDQGHHARAGDGADADVADVGAVDPLRVGVAGAPAGREAEVGQVLDQPLLGHHLAPRRRIVSTAFGRPGRAPVPSRASRAPCPRSGPGRRGAGPRAPRARRSRGARRHRLGDHAADAEVGWLEPEQFADAWAEAKAVDVLRCGRNATVSADQAAQSSALRRLIRRSHSSKRFELAPVGDIKARPCSSNSLKTLALSPSWDSAVLVHPLRPWRLSD
jgi:hypothetical protein